jgi:hypothetical protein
MSAVVTWANTAWRSSIGFEDPPKSGAVWTDNVMSLQSNNFAAGVGALLRDDWGR